jgi:ABC-2 type transport system ATP-binding protein
MVRELPSAIRLPMSPEAAAAAHEKITVRSNERSVEAHATEGPSAIDVESVSRVFDGGVLALDRVSLNVGVGEIHALLGPNGAGKTTLLRLLTGLVEPTEGTARVLGLDAAASPRALRQVVGLVPSGDRTFYLRISALENLVFFARLYGFSRRDAENRARRALDDVDLAESARRPVGNFSHGMQKRLSVARALIADPAVLLVDEATHDLDPLAARRVRDLVRAAARRGTAVVWATQRVEEIRGLADAVTVLNRGRAMFSGSVNGLVSHATPRRYLVHVRLVGERHPSLELLNDAMVFHASAQRVDELDAGAYLVSLAPEASLGNALAALHEAGVDVVHCTEAESNIEEAFLAIVGEAG